MGSLCCEWQRCAVRGCGNTRRRSPRPHCAVRATMVAGFLHFYIIFPWPSAFLMKFLRKYIIFTLNYQNIGGSEQKNCIIAGISPPALGLRVNSCTFAAFKSSMTTSNHCESSMTASHHCESSMTASHHCESSMTASNHSIKPQQPQAITTQYGRGLPHRTVWPRTSAPRKPRLKRERVPQLPAGRVPLRAFHP